MDGSLPAGPVLQLTNADLQAFFGRGFVLLRGVFSEVELAMMRRACDRLQQQALALAKQFGPGAILHRGSQFVLGEVASGPLKGQPRIDRVVWCGAAEPDLLAVGEDLRLVGIAAQVLGTPEMDQLISQVHFKLPNDGVTFPWHQDCRHRRWGTPEWTDVNGRGSFVEMVTALDDCALDNGPMFFVEDSTRHGPIETSAPDHIVPQQYIDRDKTVAATMQAGDVLIFGPYVLHGSYENTSARPRRLLLNGYAAPGANRRVYPGEGAGRRVEVGQSSGRRPTVP